jgi:hypothetical protein
MKATTRRTIAMARRALNFATAHPIADSGYTAAVARLKDDVGKADTLGQQQIDGGRKESAAISRRLMLRRTMRTQLLKRLASIELLNEKEHPELAGMYDLPPAKGPIRSFLLQAQTILSNATEQKDLLAQLGMGDTLIADLTSAIAVFETATTDSHSARAVHTGARGAFSALAKRCDSEVTMIGTYLEAVYANDDETLAAWRSARNLAGPFKRSAAATPAPAPEPDPVPAPAPSPSPAPVSVQPPGSPVDGTKQVS